MKKIFLILLLTGAIIAQTKIEMPSIFGDNMVLQQKSNVPFWGKALPNTNVVIKASWGSSAKTAVNEKGIWNTKLKTPKYGGPYLINLKIGDSTITYKNVLVGEVWLCSGQSNMEMPLEGWPPKDLIVGADEAIKNSANKNIRLFTVTRNATALPEFNCVGNWEEQNPESAAKFSATAFFFGQKLFNELKIPIGLIHSSWGGTPVEAWTSGKNIVSVDKYKDIVKNIEHSFNEIDKVNSWLNSRPTIDVSKREQTERWLNLDFNDTMCSSINFNDEDWKEMPLPMSWEKTEVGNFDGAIWFRKKISIPSNWMNKDLTLELGPIDDMDITFVNGKKIGGYETDGFWQIDRIYSIPAELNTDTTLSIAVRVVDNQGGGGIWGIPDKLNIHPKDSEEKISLVGNWKYLPVAQYSNGKFFLFDIKEQEFFTGPKLPIEISAYTPTTLYNGMLAPIIPFTIKGAIWYQGESNTGEPQLYKILLPLMISNWREDWQINFPFYYVQIAPYNYGPATKSQILRESQLLTLNTPKTGMAVTMDIGNAENIHPNQKREVGERLALWALAKDYSKHVVPSGPIYKSMEIVGGKIILDFDYADGLKINSINGKNNFQIAGEDKIFKDAQIEIKGNKLFIFSEEIKNPSAVRYCWDNFSYGTLFNKFNLPASSFRTDNWND